MKIVAISDTHNRHNKVVIPECDVLIHAGDESFRGLESETRNFAKWLNKQPAKHIIWTPGNHSYEFEQNYPASLLWMTEGCPRVNVLINKSVVIDGIKFYGSPVTPTFYNWAYMKDRGPAIKAVWDAIDEDTDVLVTHGGPKGILDAIYEMDGITIKEHVGCQDLFEKVIKLPNLKLMFYGHIHGGHGSKEFNGVHFYNCAICDERYAPTNSITVVEFEK